MKLVRSWYRSDCGSSMCCEHAPRYHEEVSYVASFSEAYQLMLRTSPEVVKIAPNRYGGVTGLIHHYEIVED